MGVGGIFETHSCDWLNGIQYHIFDSRQDTEFNVRWVTSPFPPPCRPVSRACQMLLATSLEAIWLKKSGFRTCVDDEASNARHVIGSHSAQDMRVQNACQ